MVKKIMAMRVTLRLTFLFVLLGLPLAMLAHATWLDPRDDYADQGVLGPYDAVPDGIGADGRPRFKPGVLLSYVRPGQRFVWMSSVCLEQGASMIAQAVQVRLRDGAEFPGRKRLITPDEKRCGPAPGSAIAPDLTPVDGNEAVFELQRRATVRPTSWLPLRAPLRPLSYKVRQPHGTDDGTSPAD